MGTLNQINLDNLSDFLDHSNDMFAVVNAETAQFVYFNDTLIDVLGYSEDHLEEMCVYDISQEFTGAADWRAHVENVKAHERMIREDKIQMANGTWLEVEISTSFLNSDKQYHIAVVRDISGRKKLDRQLKEFHQKTVAQNNELIEMNERLKRMFAFVAHDLRDPITQLLHKSDQLLKGYKLDPAEELNLEKDIYQLSLDADKLINDVLNLSTVMNEKFELNSTAFNLKDLGKILSHRFDVLAEKMGISLRVQFSDQHVWGDLERIDQVMSNLILNAFKYTPKGGFVEISTEENDLCVVLHVKDSGVGFPEEVILHIFDRKLHIPAENEVEVLGYGLPISQEIVRAHNSKIEIDSLTEEGLGADFHFTLPRA